jgi:hypothetical protein
LVNGYEKLGTNPEFHRPSCEPGLPLVLVWTPPRLGQRTEAPFGIVMDFGENVKPLTSTV